MAKPLEFEQQLPLIDKALTLLMVLMCLAGLVFIIKGNASAMSIMTMIATMIISLSIYLFKVLAIGLSRYVLALSPEAYKSSLTMRPELKKVSDFGLCTFCNQFETKNTLSSRYVCSDCYQIFLKVRGQILLPNACSIPSLKKVG
ncbi:MULTISPECIES: hypothetical protein [unclassified Shewanella]|uniref:hypothetical protein n=1 Tax=unclassified Shewanella TaxID=196818 RepID=UPI001BB86BE8|nr:MULTISPECIES: hypothetical protein [unclassified Shewanella]GIU07848.1 hypothetical protein TUM4444_07930 [Shewanella sp. MBTL60-112-B1]GIU30500.1 hypothetical protein TUM4445_13920 [Shewanella sp. MBTL60-112-B2]